MEEDENEPSKIKLLAREERVDIFQDAAGVGRLTRLNEYVVEQVAGPKEVNKKHSIGSDAASSQIQPSNFLIAIQEAAEKGEKRGREAVVIENFKEREDTETEVIDLEAYRTANDQSKISKFLQLEKKRKVVETPLERAERIKEAMENVNLLSPTPIQPLENIKRNIPMKLREDLAKLVAKESDVRQARFEDEESDLKVRFQCECPYCKNASPFQTNYYQRLHQKQLEKKESMRTLNAVLNTDFQSASTSLSKVIKEKEEEDGVVDEKVLRLRKQVEESIKADEARRHAEIEDSDKAEKHANIEAARAMLEKNLFKPEPVEIEATKKQKHMPPTSTDINIEVLFGTDLFGHKKYRARAVPMGKDQESNDTSYQLQMDEEMERGDLKQLTELYDRQEAGEIVDGERIYELELFDRFRREAYMTEDERSDFEIYRKRRQRTDDFIKEYETIIKKEDFWTVEDEMRVHNLELVIKKRALSQAVTEKELVELLQFEAEEFQNDGLDIAILKTSYSKQSSSKPMTEESQDFVKDFGSSFDRSQQLKIKPFAVPSPDTLPYSVIQETSDSISTNREEHPDVKRVSSQSSSSSNSKNYSFGSSLSSLEIDELNHLLNLKEDGEDLAENRLYELELFERWQYGEELDHDELDDLDSFRKRWGKERYFRKEFERLVELNNRKQDVDRDRLYCLQLYARRHVGEELTSEETLSLDNFEREEEGKRTKKSKLGMEHYAGKASVEEGKRTRKSKVGMEHYAGEASVEEGLSERTSQDKGQDDESVMIRNPLGNVNLRVASSKTSPSMQRILEESTKEDIDEGQALSPKEVNGLNQQGIEKESKVDFNDEDSYGFDRIPLESKNENWISTSGDPGIDIMDEMHFTNDRVKRDDTVRAKAQIEDIDENDHSSFLSPIEEIELNDLLESQAKGQKVKEKLVHDYNLIKKWERKELLTDQEWLNLESLREKRRKDRRYKKEFESLLERSDNGADVDEERIYFLELYIRRVVGEDLTEEERLDLDDFEEGEEEHTTSSGNYQDGRKFEASQNKIQEKKVYTTDAELEDEHQVVDNCSNQPDGNSLLSLGEIVELRQLLGGQAEGYDVDHERLQLMNLIDRWQLDGDLTDDEKKDLDKFREHWPKYRLYKKEFENLLRRSNDGEEVDEERIYLQLYARRLLFEEPTEDEILYLQEMERDTQSFCSKNGKEAGGLLKSNLIQEAIDDHISTTNEIHRGSNVKTLTISEDYVRQHQRDREIDRPNEPATSKGLTSQSSTASESGTQSQFENGPIDGSRVIRGTLETIDAQEARSVEEGDSQIINAHCNTPRDETRTNLFQLNKESKSKQEEGSNPRSSLTDGLHKFQSYINGRMKRQIKNSGEMEQPPFFSDNDTAKGEASEVKSKRNISGFSNGSNMTESEASRSNKASLFIDKKKEIEGLYRKMLERGMSRSAMEQMMIFDGVDIEIFDAMVRSKLESEERGEKESIEEEKASDLGIFTEMDYILGTTVGIPELLPQEFDGGSEVVQNRPIKPAVGASTFLDTANKTLQLQLVTKKASTGLLMEKMKDPFQIAHIAEESAKEEKRAQDRRARARKVVEQRRLKAVKEGKNMTPAGEAERERREQTRIAVEKRKRKTREAMEARKDKTRKSALEKIKKYEEMKNLGIAEKDPIEATKDVGKILKKGLTGIGNKNQPKEPDKNQVGKKPDPTTPTELIKEREIKNECVTSVDIHDPPACSNSDPPGIHYSTSNFVLGDASKANEKKPSNASEMIKVVVIEKSINGEETAITCYTTENQSQIKDEEITHEDWYAKMEKIAISQTYAEELGPNKVQDPMNPEEVKSWAKNDWHNEIAILSQSRIGNVDADADMKKAIADAHRHAQEDNFDVDDEVDHDIENFRNRISEISKSEAVNQIFVRASIEAKSLKEYTTNELLDASSFPDLGSMGDDIRYAMETLSNSNSEKSGYKLRSNQTTTSTPHGEEESFIVEQQMVRSLSKRSNNSKSRKISTQTGNKKRDHVHQKQVHQIGPAGNGHIHVNKAKAPDTPVNNIRKRKANRMTYISWRSNPFETFSDWKVEIKHKETGKVDVYNLHRNVLGYGFRKSEFFAQQFLEHKVDGYCSKKSPQITRLDLPKSWANLFPMVLDFIYCNKENNLKVTAERACALFKWAEFLKVSALQKAILDFYSKNLSLRNFNRFMTSAVKMKAGPLVVASKTKIGELVTAQPQHASRLSPQFLATILEVNQMNLMATVQTKDPQDRPQAFKQASHLWSKAVYSCISKNKIETSRQLFEELTSEKVLPAIDPSIALKFLYVDMESHTNSDEYSNFQKRCVHSIIEDWERFQLGFSSLEKMMAALQRLPSEVLTEILMVSSRNKSKSNP